MTRVEEILKAIVNGETTNIKPHNQIEEYLLAMLNGETDVPEPRHVNEAYLYQLCKQGVPGGGGGNSTYNVEYDFGNTIPADHFKDDTSIKKVNFPNVTSIWSSAFEQCTALAEINIPNLTNLGSNAFYGCASLKKIDFPNILRVKVDTFYGCVALTEVNFPKIKRIDSGAFMGCINLTKFEILDEDETFIGYGAFYNCTSLKSLIIRKSEICNIDVSSILGTKIVTEQGAPVGEGFIYVPSALLESYITDFVPKIIALAQSFGMPMDEPTATYIATAIFRPLEDYTVDGTVTGELDESKI